MASLFGEGKGRCHGGISGNLSVPSTQNLELDLRLRLPPRVSTFRSAWTTIAFISREEFERARVMLFS